MEPHGFLQQALVYLAAGVIAVPLCKRLGLGSVLGYLVAGMAIGPWGLRLIADPQTVLQFSEFGVVLLLFLIGLELNPQRVWALRRTIFGLGGVQVVATIAAVAGIGVALGLPLAVSAIAGMGFAMSSTAIGLATLTEKNLLPTPGGQASFAVLLFQDLAVIPLLLVVGLFFIAVACRWTSACFCARRTWCSAWRSASCCSRQSSCFRLRRHSAIASAPTPGSSPWRFRRPASSRSCCSGRQAPFFLRR